MKARRIERKEIQQNRSDEHKQTSTEIDVAG